jgi:DNA (cytosine-5)-methyltransferase 1
VAHRDGGVFQFPQPTHFAAETQLTLAHATASASLSPYMTAWDAIGGMELSATEDLRVKGQWADLLPSIPEGENYLWHTHRKGGLQLFGWRTRYWSFLLKLAKDKPSWTIQAQPGPAIGPFHWESRLLSVSELARIQTFPTDIKITGGRIAVQRQLGNAVPSLMSEILGRAILEQLFGRAPSQPPKLVVPCKRPIPAPEAVRPVPEKFLHLIGEHEDHPGDGKGIRKTEESVIMQQASILSD